MQIFLDTANLKEIQTAAGWGAIDGVTTNPSLVARENNGFHSHIKEICALVKGPVFAEVISTDTEGMVREGIELSAISPQIVVKIPMLREGMSAVSQLKAKGIKVAVTLVFSVPQALLAAKAGADYVAPFLGRVDDVAGDGLALAASINEMLMYYNFKTQVIAASVRHTPHVLGCLEAAIPCATMPFGVLEAMFPHPLTKQGIDKFLADWQKAGVGK